MDLPHTALDAREYSLLVWTAPWDFLFNFSMLIGPAPHCTGGTKIFPLLRFVFAYYGPGPQWKHVISSCLATFIFYIFHVYFINMDWPALHCTADITKSKYSPSVGVVLPFSAYGGTTKCAEFCLWMWSVKLMWSVKQKKHSCRHTQYTYLLNQVNHNPYLEVSLIIIECAWSTLPMEAQPRQPFPLLRLGHRPWWKTFARLISLTWLLGRKDFKNVP